MFNIGFTELIILAVIGLLVIGPEQLPEMARKVAKLINELKRAKDELFSPVENFKDEALRAVDRVRSTLDQQITETQKKEMQKNTQEKTTLHSPPDKAKNSNEA